MTGIDKNSSRHAGGKEVLCQAGEELGAAPGKQSGAYGGNKKW